MEKAKRYRSIQYRVLLVNTLLTAAYVAVLILGGGAAWLWRAAPHPAWFLLLLLLGQNVLSLPTDFCLHRLARAYGTSVQGTGGWLADQAKSFMLGLVLYGLPALGLLRLWSASPATWHLWTALGAVLIDLLLTFVAPVLIAPLFQRFTPLPDGELKDRLLALSARAGVRVKGVYVAQVSRKQTTLNAWLSGVGATRRMVLFDTLIEAATPDEVTVVMGHELGHHVYGHIAKMTAISCAGLGAGFVAAGYVLAPLSTALGLGGLTPMALPLLAALYGVGGLVGMPAFMALSRQWERDCDAYALKLTGNPAAFISVFRKMESRNLADPTPPRWVYYFLYSHPPIPERIAMAERFHTPPVSHGGI